jgi:hypothetical protein
MAAEQDVGFLRDFIVQITSDQVNLLLVHKFSSVKLMMNTILV